MAHHHHLTVSTRRACVRAIDEVDGVAGNEVLVVVHPLGVEGPLVKSL